MNISSQNFLLVILLIFFRKTFENALLYNKTKSVHTKQNSLLEHGECEWHCVAEQKSYEKTASLAEYVYCVRDFVPPSYVNSRGLYCVNFTVNATENTRRND